VKVMVSPQPTLLPVVMYRTRLSGQ
jgi:hypothetical protein